MMASTPPAPVDADAAADQHIRCRLRTLLLQQKHTDCSFLIESTTINSHRIILATASPVFEAMLFGPLAETRRIHITDIGADAFRLMLEYIYTDELSASASASSSIDDLIEVYYGATKYMLAALQRTVQQRLRRALRHDNILRAIDGAVALRAGELLDMTVRFFVECCLIGRFFAGALRQNYYHVALETLNYVLARTATTTTTPQADANVVQLVRKWCRTEATAMGHPDVRRVMADVRMSPAVEAAVRMADSRSDDDDDDDSSSSANDDDAMTMQRSTLAMANNDTTGAWMRCMRRQFRAVRPLRQAVDQPAMHFETSMQSDRFIALRALCINSRLMPAPAAAEQTQHGRRRRLSQAATSYTERVTVILQAQPRLNATQPPFSVRKTCTVFGTAYNSTVHLRFESPVLIVPNVCYAIRLQWDACTAAEAREYPRSLMATGEAVNVLDDGDCKLLFDGHLNEEAGDVGVMMGARGSVLVGLEFVVLG